MRQGARGVINKPASQVDYPDCSLVKMYWDYRSVAAPNKLRCLITGVEVTTEKSLFSVDADNKLNIADDEWKTILYTGTAAAMETNNFALFMGGVFGALGAAGGYFKVGDSVDVVDLSSQYGPGISLRSGGSGVVLDENNFMTGTPILEVVLPFTGSHAILLDQDNSGVYKTLRGSTNTSGSELISDDPGPNAGSFSAYPWPAFSPFITYESGFEDDYGPVKNWAHGVALPRDSVMDFACVVAYEDGLPTTAEIDRAGDYISAMKTLPPWWR